VVSSQVDSGDEVLNAMFRCLSQSDPIYLPSAFWQDLNRKNLQQIETEGLVNFKQTVAQNYFTWVIGRHSDQFQYLVQQTRASDWLPILFGAWSLNLSPRLGWREQIQLTIFTRMLWKFAERQDSQGLLRSLEEPRQGTPFNISLGRKLISQDLANSVLEYYAIREHFVPRTTDRVTICELGAGYGRNAYVFMKALPNCKYIIVDIPPALRVAQHYLPSVLPGVKTFPFRCFEDFEEVEAEFQEADLAFLLPHQAAKLKPKCVDLFVNISSLHEMTHEQIRAYFALIDRLTSGYFYSKQWILSKNAADQIEVRWDDYPVPRHWRQLFHRPAKVQRAFFEAMYAIDPNDNDTTS
jgi:putative sugar O-methyltransferase